MRGLYVHLPFCRNKCSYCGFYSDTASYGLAGRYVKCLTEDLRSRNNLKYDTLYIGGGTPSSVPPFVLSELISGILHVTGAGFSELTIEANPESVTEDFLAVVNDFGFTRLSMGCQSTDDGVLKLLGRIHSVKDIYNAYGRIIRKLPDISLNLDMIFDIPTVLPESELKTLEDIVSLQPQHISAYSYSFDTGYLADAVKREDSLFLQVKHRLADAGFHKYEISNFAKKGHESRHNINYWMLGDYDGIGASAWSLINYEKKRILRGKNSNLSNYLDNCLSYEEENVSKEPEKAFEEIVFGLRMLDGFDFSGFNNMYGAETCKLLKQPLKWLTDEEFISWDSDWVRLTEKGELFLDSVQEYLWGFLP